MSNFIQILVAGITLLVCYILDQNFEWDAATRVAIMVHMAIAFVGYPIGWLVGRYLAADADVDSNGFRVVAFLGLPSCVSPVIGVAMSAVIWQFYLQSSQYRWLYYGVSAVVGMLAVVNALYGAGAFGAVA